MKRSRTVRIVFIASLSLAALVLTCNIAVAQNIQGVINGRSGATMTLQTQDSGNVVVILTPSTEVDEVEGLLRARRKEMAVTALIPGLPVQVQGSYNAQNQLVANVVKFKGSDLKNAEDFQAGITPTEQQVQANQQQMQQQKIQLAAEQQKTEANQAAIAANKAKIAAEIAADNKRFGELADYNILGEVTVYFANGSTAIEAQYKQVQGYASSVGSAALNQRLSSERAANVTEFLEQQGNIPLTNMLAPGAMGTSHQVASDATAEGQAEDRRVVVKILQNKGIAGT
jgi:outer membrane protein OmpA-like peptidoglycan-associated protein